MDTLKEKLSFAVDWPTTLFLFITPIASAASLPFYFYFFGFNAFIFVGFLVYWFAMSFCITAGYHRLFAHRSFRSRKWFQALLLFFGAGTYQGSALQWATDHRIHHKNVDSHEDPYSINKGFWYAHIGWLFNKNHPRFKSEWPVDLKNNTLVMFQHNYYYTLAMLAGFAVPTFIGWVFGDAMGGFLLIGLARIVIGHHTTFFINSLAHVWGKQPYNKGNTARDSHILAFLTNGEGYHNFHHKFEGDYRNGIKWYQWDPTKWAIKILSLFGQTYKLQTVNHYQIIKAKLIVKKDALIEKGANIQQVENFLVKVEEANKKLTSVTKEYTQLTKSLTTTSQNKIKSIKAEIRLAQNELQFALSQFQILAQAYGI